MPQWLKDFISQNWWKAGSLLFLLGVMYQDVQSTSSRLAERVDATEKKNEQQDESQAEVTRTLKSLEISIAGHVGEVKTELKNLNQQMSEVQADVKAIRRQTN